MKVVGKIEGSDRLNKIIASNIKIIKLYNFDTGKKLLHYTLKHIVTDSQLVLYSVIPLMTVLCSGWYICKSA